MRAVQFSETGGPEVLRVVDVPEPHAGPGEIRIAVRAAAVNPIDFKFRAGYMKVPLPHIPGFDAAGVVDEVGAGAKAQVGDEVFGQTGAGYAEFAVLTHWAIKPADVSFAEAASWVTAAETSTRSLDLVGIKDGGTVVIAGAAGGVGAAAVQIAVARGARVIGTASEANHDFLRSLGAEPTTYGDGLVDRVRALAPDGIDAGFDTAGKGAVKDLIELTGDPQKVVTIADFGDHGAQITTGSSAWNALADASHLHDMGKFSVPIAATYTFDRAGEAHAAQEGGHTRGKLILTP